MATELKTILNLEVPVIVQVGLARISLDDVLALGPGAIIDLEKESEEELTLLVNNRPIGSGVAVKVGENFGLEVTNINSRQEIVSAMGDAD